jgi:cellulose biosynthesis protein BcsQ
MKTVAVVSDKGGTGKSVFATELATQASALAPTLVIDTDPQASVKLWSARRPPQLTRPKCLASTALKLPEHVADARRARFEWTIIDTASGAPLAARAAVEAADAVLIPIKADLSNFEGIIKTVQMVRSYRKMYGIFINDAPAKRDGREGPLVREIRSKMHEEQYRAHFGKYLWNEQITGRNVVPTALNKGLGVVEASTDVRAEEEFRSLWTAMIHLLQVGGTR